MAREEAPPRGERPPCGERPGQGYDRGRSDPARRVEKRPRTASAPAPRGEGGRAPPRGEGKSFNSLCRAIAPSQPPRTTHCDRPGRAGEMQPRGQLRRLPGPSSVTVGFHFMKYSFGRGGEGCGGDSRAPERDTSSMQFNFDYIMITAMKGSLAQRNLDIYSSGTWTRRGDDRLNVV